MRNPTMPTPKHKPVAHKPIARLLDLVDDSHQHVYNMSVEDARARLLSEDPHAVREIEGSFALTIRDGIDVVLARSLDRPLRYFLAKEVDGPMLVVAERIDEIRDCLRREGYGEQFHPSYTRMVPAHHVTRLQLVGCPDPNPSYRRFFDPPRGVLPPDLDLLGERYVGALLQQVRQWLLAVPEDEPLGVLFSGGADSGAVLLAVHHLLLELGMSPARLKAFTLSVDGRGRDARQAREFLRTTGLEMLGEEINVPASALDPFRAIEVIEDYKPLDVECATVGLALLEAVRERYPDWRYLADGDGGDENLKDYPIEENSELTIRSVVNNSMLYQEGWGVDKIKHSLTYSGGMSRGCVRTWAPARELGFLGFSPFTRPAVIEIAEAIPFAELAKVDESFDGSPEAIERSHGKLYALKGEVLRRGLKHHLDVDMPVFPKRRFQHGAADDDLVRERFAISPLRYRRHFADLHA